MTTVHFIRHGNVENPDNIYYGRLPGFRLSQEGERCIEQTARQLQGQAIARIYHSPLLRAEQSAAILSRILLAPMLVDERLIEIATSFEGRSMAERFSYPQATNGYEEAMETIYERMITFLKERAEQHPDQQIVAVSHGGPIRLLAMGLQGLSFTDQFYESEPIPSCGERVTVVVQGEQITLRSGDLPTD